MAPFISFRLADDFQAANSSERQGELFETYQRQLSDLRWGYQGGLLGNIHSRVKVKRGNRFT
jgi:hypothetical protein